MTDTDKKNCGCGCCPQTASAYLIPQKIEAHAPLPMYKGEPFTYEDFTPEQIEDLQRPATDAATEAQVLMAGFSKAEVTRESNEQSRISAENTRVSREELRQTAETARQANETAREAAEAKRVEAENARKTAEQERATEFATWEAELDNKAERSELSNIIGTPTEEEIEDIDPTLVTEALRKVPQALTPEEQAQVKANLNISKMELFCDLFSAAAGDAGYARMVNGVFDGMLNGLPVTYEEAITIYYETVIRPYPRGVFEYSVSKTLLPLHMPYEQTAKVLFENCLNLEIIGPASLSSFSPTNITRTFAGCVKLRRVEVLTYFGAMSGGDTCFENCRNLEFVNFGYLRCDLDLHWSPKLTLEMMNKMVASNRLFPNAGVTFTVHPNIYAKLTDETNTEWHQVLIDAAAKNITFATV